MANTWETLSQDERMKLARHIMVGKSSSPENLNRAMSILASNPKKLDEAISECYGDDGAQLQDAEPTADEPSIEDNVQDALAAEGSADMQQTGRVASEVPPPEEGENIQEYMMRLQQLMQAGGRGQGQHGAPSGQRMMEETDE